MFPSAQAKILVTSGLVDEYSLERGGAARGVITLKSLGKKPEQVKIYVQHRSADGAQKSHARSSKTWIKVSTGSLVMQPGQSHNVSYQLKVPANSGNGTYWSRIIVEPVKADSVESALNKLPPVKNGFYVGIRSVSRYAIDVMSHIGSNFESKYLFANPKLELSNGRKVLRVDVKNVGNRHGYPIPRLDVFNNSGKVIASLVGNKRGLYPQFKKRITIPVHTLRVGNYKTLLTLEDALSGRTFGTDLNLSILP